jgi:low affinity Fe/Cu permease
VSANEHFVSGANLSISIVTLLLLPILQSTQNRDGAALQAKIDELIKANSDARDDLIGLENREEEDIEQIRLDEGQRSSTRPSNEIERCGFLTGASFSSASSEQMHHSVRKLH